MDLVDSRNIGALRTGALASFDRSEQGFLFPFDDIHPKLLEQPLDLGSGWTLRRSSVSEWREFGVYNFFEDWMQHRFGERNVAPPQAYKYEDGEYGEVLKYPQEWRFAILEANPKEIGLGPNSLSQALFLSPWRIHIGGRSSGKSNPQVMSCWHDFPGLGVRSVVARTISSIQQSRFGFPEMLHDQGSLQDPDDLKSVRQIIEFRRKEAGANLTGPMYRMMALDRLIDREPLKALGYFAIVEALLTHAPAQNDPHDSITRQLKRNLNLVENQLEQLGLAIGFNDHFNCKFDKVVTHLYSFRSSIAHGGDVENAVKKIANISKNPSDVDYTWIVKFVDSICRGIIVFGLFDSMILEDVKG